MKKSASILEQKSQSTPRWVVSCASLLSAGASALVLWATWFFYKDLWNAPGFSWFDWIQPVLQILACFTLLIAAVLLAVRKPAGFDVLKIALCFIPIISLFRLVMVVLKSMGNVPGWISENAGRLSDGTFLDQLNQGSLKVVLIIVGVTVVLTLLGLIKKSEKTRERSDDEREKGR